MSSSILGPPQVHIDLNQAPTEHGRISATLQLKEIPFREAGLKRNLMAAYGLVADEMMGLSSKWMSKTNPTPSVGIH